ncbi:MAG: polysaccharide biosynthesis tyrosine autokinase [Armatimonadetes bacterium]|nr:polysaccharide biosynthesis tyrosine autokinase [Armatimonadota bacterium]
MELWRYYRILRRRRWLIVFCVAVCVGVVGIHASLSPKLYTGRATVMERQPTERGVPVYGDRYVVQPNVDIHLADLANIATSNSVILRSRDTLGQLGIAIDPRQLMNTLKIQPLYDTQILAIEVTSQDPDEAKSAADVVSGEFRRFYQQLMSGAAEQSREFIEKQLKDAKAKRAETREARKNFKMRNELVDLGMQAKVLMDRSAEIETQVVHAGVAAAELNDRLRIVDEQIASQPEMKLSLESTTNNPIYQELLARKIAAEADLGTMVARRGRNHPEVQILTKQLEEVNEIIKTQSPKIVSQETVSENQVYRTVLQNRLALNAEAAGTGAREAALLAVLSEEKAKMGDLPAQEMKMAQLQMDVTAAEETYRLLRAKLDEARIKANEASRASAIQVIDAAYVYPVDRKTPLKLVLALVLSPLLGAGLVFLLNYLDNTVKTPAEAEDLFGLPVVTVVPLSRSHALAKRPENEPLLATYEMLTSVLWRNIAKTPQPTILVASAEPDTGRSTTAANLAITLARDGARVILVDSDMRKPCLNQMFGVSGKPGLSNILSGGVAIEDALAPTRVEGLLLLPAGPPPDNPIRLLRTQQMAEFVSEVGKLADFVIFDSPAGITFADASLIASHVRNTIIVHAAGKVPRGSETEFRTKLDLVGANIVGVALNRVRPEDSHGHFHYRRFYQDETAQDRSRALSGAVRAIPPGGSDEL